MKCKKCDGVIFLDRTEVIGKYIEMSCVRCGRRWELKAYKNTFTIWLLQLEKRLEKSFNGSR